MECKQDYVEGMTLGDHFIDTLQKAWDLQDARQRQGMSPKYVHLFLPRKHQVLPNIKYYCTLYALNRACIILSHHK